MFYRPEDGHGLPHNPFNALIVPRPIAWISTRDGTGVRNLAPYSFFNGVAYSPPQVMFASASATVGQSDAKDTLANIRETGVFCVNLVNATSAALPRHVDEFAQAGLTALPCTTIDCPRIAAVPASLECRMRQIVPLEGVGNFITIGEVVGIHLCDAYISEGKFDVARFRPLSRLGYRDYSVVESVFAMERPDARPSK